jgi:hypothetical protein
MNPFISRQDKQVADFEYKYGPIILKVLNQLSQVKFGGKSVRLPYPDMPFPDWALRMKDSWLDKSDTDLSINISIHIKDDKYVLWLMCNNRNKFNQEIIDIGSNPPANDVEYLLIDSIKRLMASC